jgi:hypothetical protein
MLYSPQQFLLVAELTQLVDVELDDEVVDVEVLAEYVLVVDCAIAAPA